MSDQDLIKGSLSVTAKKAIRLKFVNKKGKNVEIAAAAEQLSADFFTKCKSDVASLEGQTVEFQLAGPNKAAKIRPAGKPWEPPGSPRPTKDDRPNVLATRMELGFHNPYNFVPAPPRPKQPANALNDGRPSGHHCFRKDLFTGWIDLEMGVKTPLLIPDAMNAREVKGSDGHKSFPIRIGPQGKPYVSPTSVKGMLRSAYEAITNSRLSVFVGHKEPLAYRMPARDGLRLVPAVVENGQITLLAGTSTFSERGPSGPMYAAWLHSYPFGNNRPPNWRGLNRHGQKVWAYITLWEHGRFRFWNVVELQPDGPARPSHTPTGNRRPWRNARPASPPKGQWVSGYVCITRRNIDRKHDERLFFTIDPRPPKEPLGQSHKDRWKALIANYQKIHEAEIAKGMKHPPALPDHCVWSRYIEGNQRHKDDEQRLNRRTLCYAAVEANAGNVAITELYPVNISRKLFPVSPQELLPRELAPAASLDEMSPADRVFGWVSQQSGKKGAYRGQVRINPIVCESDDAIETFGFPGVPLAILGAPMPQQARFYAAATTEGNAQPNELSQEQAGYQRDKGLRGRKVYPHHHGEPDKETGDYWADPLGDRTNQPQNGWCQEYRRPDSESQRDDQNRSIQAWVRVGAVFSFRLHVTNLSEVELGALFWLLSLEDNQFHRLGAGKPLGFGSVNLKMRGLDLRNGRAWGAYYKSLSSDMSSDGARVNLESGAQNAGNRSVDDLIHLYQEAVCQAYPTEEFGQVSFIRAFLRATEGFPDGKPLHYPRLRQTDGSTAPDPAGENFKWFVENAAKDGTPVHT